MRRTAALLALVAMASSSTAALAQGRARADAVVVESALGKIAATTTRHAGSVVWTQKDPLGFAAGDTSLYVYALGDPVSYVDPSGEICFIPLIFLVIKAADFAMNAWDTYQLIKRFMDPCVSDDDKAAELALLAAQWLGGKVLGNVLDALKSSKALAKFGCFAAGTLVATSTGLVPIEAVEPGTIVQGRNDSSGEMEWRTVTANHARPDVSTLAIGIEDEREGSWQLTTTAEHPVYVESVGYVPADRLEPGQWLVTESGASSRVVSVAPTGAAQTVYNLTVEGTENYFVGPSPVLVHNILDCVQPSPALPGNPWNPAEVEKRIAAGAHNNGPLAAKSGDFSRTNYRSHGQPVYSDGKSVISPDVDSHNGGAWKAADSVEDLGSKDTRRGTFDRNMNRIGD